jgi:hypothetical protein
MLDFFSVNFPQETQVLVTSLAEVVAALFC